METNEVIRLVSNYETITEEEKEAVTLKISEDVPTVHVDLSREMTRDIIIKLYKDNELWNDNLI